MTDKQLENLWRTLRDSSADEGIAILRALIAKHALDHTNEEDDDDPDSD